MSQKYIKYQNNNKQSDVYGKFFARAVYDKREIGTNELAEFIQTQASVKRSDVKAVLEELGEALNHFLCLGQKVKVQGVGLFKVGFSSLAQSKKEDVTADTIYGQRVIFTPETERTPALKKVITRGEDGEVTESTKQGYTTVKRMLRGIRFEETHDNAMNAA